MGFSRTVYLTSRLSRAVDKWLAEHPESNFSALARQNFEVWLAYYPEYEPPPIPEEDDPEQNYLERVPRPGRRN